jgi:hypothetical protein
MSTLIPLYGVIVVAAGLTYIAWSTRRGSLPPVESSWFSESDPGVQSFDVSLVSENRTRKGRSRTREHGFGVDRGGRRPLTVMC